MHPTTALSDSEECSARRFLSERGSAHKVHDRPSAESNAAMRPQNRSKGAIWIRRGLRIYMVHAEMTANLVNRKL